MENEFWKTKSFEEMSQEEWDLICDGCARCCVFKLEDEDTNEYFYTNVVCRLLNLETCRCLEYDNRNEIEPGCVLLTPSIVRTIKWLPETCAYRLLLEGKPLPNWHPLVSHNPYSVNAAGISIRGKVIRQEDADMRYLENYVVDWLK